MEELLAIINTAEFQFVEKKRETAIYGRSPLYIDEISNYLPIQAVYRSEIESPLSAHHVGLANTAFFMCSAVLGMCSIILTPVWNQGSLELIIDKADLRIGP